MTDEPLGRTVANRLRHARLISLGDRRAPIAQTPALIASPADLQESDIESNIAPFIIEYDSDEQPPKMTITGRAALCMPFENSSPRWSSVLGHTLPASLADADSTRTRGEIGTLTTVTWQSLIHDERLTQMQEQPEIIALVDAVQLANHQEKLATALTTLRERFPASLIWCPGLSGPDNLALLTWFGVDLHDFSRSRLAATSGMILTADGPRNPSSQFGQSSDFSTQIAEWKREISAVKEAIKRATLRQLVEMRSLNSARQVQHLRHHDELMQGALSPLTPLRGAPLRRFVARDTRWRCNSPVSRSDLLVKDWVYRMGESYRAPAETSKVLILLPCSERKPYSESQSHRRFRWQLRHRQLHEVMVTSPLGLVPRELEELWPAAHYDIPVTGSWDGDELEMVRSLVAALVKNNGYELVINHSGISLDGESLSVEVVDTRLGSGAGFGEALERLGEESKKAYEKFHAGERLNEKQHLSLKMRSISRWLHGNDLWLRDAHIAGKPPRWKIMQDKTQLAMWHPRDGRFAFAKAALPLLAETKSLAEVHLIPGPPLEGDIFPAMVDHVVGEIRIGDEVLLFREGELLGSGRSVVANWEYYGSSGRLIKTRHRL